MYRLYLYGYSTYFEAQLRTAHARYSHTVHDWSGAIADIFSPPHPPRPAHITISIQCRPTSTDTGGSEGETETGETGMPGY